MMSHGFLSRISSYLSKDVYQSCVKPINFFTCTLTSNYFGKNQKFSNIGSLPWLHIKLSGVGVGKVPEFHLNSMYPNPWRIQTAQGICVCVCFVCVCVCVYSFVAVVQSLRRVRLCDPMDCSPPRLLCPWNSSGQEYWSRLPFPSPGDLLHPGTKPSSPALAAASLLWNPLGKPVYSLGYNLLKLPRCF